MSSRRFAAFLLVLAAACGAEPEASDVLPDRAPSLPRGDSPVTSPRSLSLVPCAGEPVVWGEAPGPCVLVVAGGKRFLFGAPGGVAATLSREDSELLDAVLLFSLASKDIEGLDEVRRASWVAGRRAQLPVFGPDGVGEVVGAINAAHVRGDALTVLSQGGRGYTELPLAASGFVPPRPVPEGAVWTQLLTTGDVTVMATEAAFDVAGYRVDWIDGGEVESVVLWPCVRPMAPPPTDVPAVMPQSGGCAEAWSGETTGWMAWPVSAQTQTEVRAGTAFEVSQGRITPVRRR